MQYNHTDLQIKFPSQQYELILMDKNWMEVTSHNTFLNND